MEKQNEEQNKYNNQPIVETKVSLSNDGKWLIHKTIITDIKPVKFYNVVLQGQNQVINETQSENTT